MPETALHSPPAAAPPSPPGMLHGANVRRLMARFDMTLADVVEATGLDERTVRSILRERTRPHARTLHKLATGLGVTTDELFRDPADAFLEGAAQAEFDRLTNPVAAQVVAEHRKIFADWSPEELAELFSRVGVGGELTEAGVLAAAQARNDRRQLLDQVALLLETDEADLLRDFVELLYRRATTFDQ